MRSTRRGLHPAHAAWNCAKRFHACFFRCVKCVGYGYYSGAYRVLYRQDADPFFEGGTICENFWTSAASVIRVVMYKLFAEMCRDQDEREMKKRSFVRNTRGSVTK